MISTQDYIRLRALADRLVASCDGGRDEWDTLRALSIEECKVLDSMALECQSCNQFFAAADINDTGDEYLCSDCTP